VLYPIPALAIEALVKHLALIRTALLSLEEYVKQSHLDLLFHKLRKWFCQSIFAPAAICGAAAGGQGWPHRQNYAALDAGANLKICDFL
jgi:hypothetical protein